ncbi:hypothetical protein R1flu_024289 [Riccia fluitans]|uniref:Uncharacterized protein n=1 Tax=Riccia fluitans TaxID=41844 RepID=A0ABD1XUL4_9MARC
MQQTTTFLRADDGSKAAIYFYSTGKNIFYGGSVWVALHNPLCSSYYRIQYFGTRMHKSKKEQPEMPKSERDPPRVAPSSRPAGKQAHDAIDLSGKVVKAVC